MIYVCLLQIIIFMTEEEEDRLNFYSKYNRVKDKLGINSLYSLIDGAKFADTLQIQLFPQVQPREQLSRKASASPSQKKHKNHASAKPKAALSRSHVDESKNQLEISMKIQQLRKMEREFHEEIGRRAKEIKKKRTDQKQAKKSKQRPMISVVDSRCESPLRKQSSQLKLKKTTSRIQDSPINFQNEHLDFQDYYRQSPEVLISTVYQNADSPDNRRQLRNMLQSQKMRQKEVQSVDEEVEKVRSIVIGRVGVDSMGQSVHEMEHSDCKHINQLEMSHSRSQNILNHHKDIDQSLQIIKQQFHRENTDHWQLSSNKPKEVQSMENITPQHQLNTCQFGHTSSQQELQIPLPLSQNPGAPAVITHRTGTEEGQELKEEIADKVAPIYSPEYSPNRSQFLTKTQQITAGAVYHSQTSPPNLHLGRQVKSIATDSHDIHDLEREQMIQHKKSSFKRLMAQNRASLVPRMAISTILNEHVNQVLVDFKQQKVQPEASPPLQESIVNSQSSPHSKRKINFKKRITQQQRDKSYSRESKPVFERDPSKIQKNRQLLAGFFADN